MTDSSFDQRILQGTPRLHSFVRRQINSAADADDLVQETILKALRARDSLRDESRFEGWLYRIARRTIIDYYRRRRPSQKLPETAANNDTRDVDAITAAVERAALCYLGTLPEEYRAAVWMADYEGLPHAEIARRLGINLAAAKSRVRRGQQRIRRLMEDCCQLTYDARGKIVDYERRRPCSETNQT